MIEIGNEGPVVYRRFEWPPQEGLVEAAEAAIGIATDEIDVQRFEIAGRMGLSLELDGVEIGDMRSKDSLDAIRIGFAHGFVPSAVGRHTDLAGGISLKMAG